MTAANTTFDFSRVLVAVGAAMPGHAAVETGVDLAAAVGAALEGLFVESLDLVRVSALPDARETSALTGTRRPLGVGDVERAFRVEAARLERLLATRAARTRVTWSFSIARGELWAMALARDAELIVLEARGTATALPRTARARGPLVTVFDTSSAAWRALAATARLARTTGSELVILVPAGNAESARSARKEAEEWLAASAVPGVASPIHLEHGSVVAAARAHRAVVLVLPVSIASRWSVDVPALAADAPCPLVIAR